MQKKKNKNTIKLPLQKYLVYLCVALFLTTGVTFSKYVTSTTSADSARVAHFGELSLYETDANGKRIYDGQKFIFAPGVKLQKNPVVSFENSEMSAYVFVTVEAKGWQTTDNISYCIKRENSSQVLLNWKINETNWTPLQTNNDIIVFYHEAAAGEKLQKLSVIQDDEVIVSRDLHANEMAVVEKSVGDITLQAYAVQKDGFENIQTAWEAVSVK